jgi:hypothetical protein
MIAGGSGDWQQVLSVVASVVEQEVIESGKRESEEEVVLAEVQEQEMSEKRRSVRVHRVCEGSKWGEVLRRSRSCRGRVAEGRGALKFGFRGQG